MIMPARGHLDRRHDRGLSFGMKLLGETATRIINDVKGVRRVVYDVMSKPAGRSSRSEAGAGSTGSYPRTSSRGLSMWRSALCPNSGNFTRSIAFSRIAAFNIGRRQNEAQP